MATNVESYIYTGAWINWSRGALLGSTVTLQSREGGFFTAFLVFFVTVVGTCLWHIVSYTCHQISASDRDRDGMHHQHQLLWRNTSSPAAAALTFAQSAFFWRNSTKRSWHRSMPLATLALIYILIFSAASVFSAEVTKAAGPDRLILSDNCGIWAMDGETQESLMAMNTKNLNTTLSAAAYARACYLGGSGVSSSNPLGCNIYNAPSLSWKTYQDEACPFDDKMCLAPG